MLLPFPYLEAHSCYLPAPTTGLLDRAWKGFWSRFIRGYKAATQANSDFLEHAFPNTILEYGRYEVRFALEAARKREQTEEFKELYAHRAGVEGVYA